MKKAIQPTLNRVGYRDLLSREGYRYATWHCDTLACLPVVLPVSADRMAYFDMAPGGVPA